MKKISLAIIVILIILAVFYIISNISEKNLKGSLLII